MVLLCVCYLTLTLKITFNDLVCNGDKNRSFYEIVRAVILCHGVSA